MNEGIAIVIGAVIALAASVLTTLLQERLGKRRSIVREYVEQFKSFYELEKLYVAEIARLRHDSAASESDKEQTIKNTFRHQNEEAGNAHIRLTAVTATEFLKCL